MLKLSEAQVGPLADGRRAAFVARLREAMRRALPFEARTTPQHFQPAAIDAALARVEAAGLNEEQHVGAFVRLGIERFGGDVDACLTQPAVLAAQAELERATTPISPDFRFRTLFDAAAGLGTTMGKPRARPAPLPPMRTIANMPKRA